jgi:hypothetical protein
MDLRAAGFVLIDSGLALTDLMPRPRISNRAVLPLYTDSERALWLQIFSSCAYIFPREFSTESSGR